jgi:lysophospholipase L1-like esterase
MDSANKHFNQPDFLWVTNSGIDGLNTRHHIAHAKYLVPKIPNLDHVIIYCGINDLTDWLIQDNDYDPHFAITQENLDKQIPKAFRFSNFNSPADSWYQHLELWKRASSLKAAILSRRRAATRAQGGIVEDDRLEWLKKERAHLGRVKLSTVEPAKLATLDNALDAYAQNLAVIVQLVREAHSEAIFMAQAMQFDELNEQQKKDRWIGAMSKGTAYVELAQLQDLLRKYNDRMETVAKEHHVLFIPLPKSLEGKPDPYYDSIHFNEAGARDVAQIVSDFLIKNVYDATASKTAQH